MRGDENLSTRSEPAAQLPGVTECLRLLPEAKRIVRVNANRERPSADLNARDRRPVERGYRRLLRHQVRQHSLADYLKILRREEQFLTIDWVRARRNVVVLSNDEAAEVEQHRAARG